MRREALDVTLISMAGGVAQPSGRLSGRIVVHVLLRGVTGKPSESVPIGAHEVVIMGAPAPDTWDQDDLAGNVCEAVVTADEADVVAVLSELRRDSRVLDAWSGSGDRLSTIRQRTLSGAPSTKRA